ncbi:MAG: hypothetical protein AB203_02580 [Parcubacteria bacterium C7867-008]|nr:MAG: hypothetical protein AB203_02580 [Parcubacteria bacterium C7867-008]
MTGLGEVVSVENHADRATERDVIGERADEDDLSAIAEESGKDLSFFLLVHLRVHGATFEVHADGDHALDLGARPTVPPDSLPVCPQDIPVMTAQAEFRKRFDERTPRPFWAILVHMTLLLYLGGVYL